VLVTPVVLAALAWASLALWFDGPVSRPLATALVAGFDLTALAAVLGARRGLRIVLAMCLVVLCWWLSLAPRNDRDWQPDVARPPTAELHGDLLTVHDVRNFNYRSETDFTEHWENRTYDLSRLRGVDLFFSFWGPTLIAHTIVSWDFGDGHPLAISIETRKERGESYDALRGFFRQYELYYVVADERDVVRLRTNLRGEQVFLYRLRAAPAAARQLLLSYVDSLNTVAAHPKWYNAFTHNCTTTIRLHVQDAGIHNPWNWRLLANGKLDELLYSRGDVTTSLPFDQLRAQSDVTARARAAGDDPRFSELIRDGVPARLPPRQ
jgi:hypothetical protein